MFHETNGPGSTTRIHPLACDVDIAARLVRGDGAAGLVVFDGVSWADIEVVSHAWSDDLDGMLMACRVGAGWRCNPAQAVRVWLDHTAPLAEVDLMGATLHFLGEAILMSVEVLCVLADPDLDDAFPSSLMGAPDVALVLVCPDPDQMVLHARGRGVPLDVKQVLLRQAWPIGVEELEAADVVLAHGETELARWAGRVVQGGWPGSSLVFAPCEHLAEALVDRALLVDVGPHGLSVMTTESGVSRLVQIDFVSPARTLDRLDHELMRLTFQAPELTEFLV